MVRRRLVFPCILTAVWFAAGCGDGRRPLVLYSPHGRDLLQLVERSYEELHPEVDVRWLDMGSQNVYDRLRSERANPQADVWFGGPWPIFARAANEQLLEPYRPAWADSLPAWAQEAENRFFAVYQTPTVLVYNEDAVPAAQAPADWPDLLLPFFADRIVVRDPIASGTMRAIFGYLLADSLARTGDTAEGFAFLRALDAQTREYVHSPALLHEKESRQDGLATVWELSDNLNLRARGAPLGFRFPRSGAPVIPDAVALVRGAKHRAEATSFLDWIGGDQAVALAAQRAFRLPARAVPLEDLPAWAQEVTSQLRPAAVDWRLLEERSPEWMAEWDRNVRARGAAGPAPP